MTKQPVIRTERLILRPLRNEDLDAFVEAVFADPEVMKTLVGDASTPERQRQLAAEWMESWNSHWEPKDHGVWAVCIGDPGLGLVGKLIGFCGFGVDITGEHPELIYALARPYWGKGLTTEAATACVEYLFTETAATRFELVVVHRRNRESIRVAEKIGATYERDLPVSEYLSEPYRQGTLEFELFRVRTAVNGRRLNALEEAAFKIGQLVVVGTLERSAAEQQLWEAAEACGLMQSVGWRYVLMAIRHGLEAGIEDPMMVVYSMRRPAFARKAA